MSEYKINIYHLFPDLLTLGGDKGNISVLTKRCRDRGIKVNYTKLLEGGVPDFTEADIVLFGSGTDAELLTVLKYTDMTAGPLKEYVENDGVCLAIDSSYQLLGNSFEVDGETFDGFKILDTDAVSGKKRLTGNIITEAELNGKTVRIAGFENHIARTDIKNHTPFGKVISGYGNNDEMMYEGVIYKNTIATHIGGPLLPKNPELADYLISAALTKKYEDFTELDTLDDSAEMLAKEFVIERELKKRQ